MVADAETLKAEITDTTMHTSGGVRLSNAPEDPRVTCAGHAPARLADRRAHKWINVSGEMSLVAPRPLILTED
jgi:hypothetical protein